MLDLSCDMTPSELFQAYYDCRRTKRNSPSALKFEDALERNLMHLYHELISGEYAPGQTTVFVVEYPKVREMRSKLYLGLHPNKTSINKVEHGFDALGYVIRPYCKYLRRSTVRNAFAKLGGMCRANVPVETIRDVANSYFGILGHSESWRERTRLANMLKGHGHIISLQADHMFSGRIPI